MRSEIVKTEEQALVRQSPQSGKVGWALAWLLGIPLPVLLIIYLFTR